MASWSFTQTRFRPSVFPPWLLSYVIHRRQSLAIYPVSIVNSVSESKQEAGCKFLTWNPAITRFNKCIQEASCKCPAWSPSFSYPKKCKQKPSCRCLAWGLSVSLSGLLAPVLSWKQTIGPTQSATSFKSPPPLSLLRSLLHPVQTLRFITSCKYFKSLVSFSFHCTYLGKLQPWSDLIIFSDP